MNVLNCMVVDDEPIARDLLKSYISKISGLHLVKSCMNATEAYEGLYQHKVDLIFLDIHMPVITGTDFLRSLRNPPMVIFTTAYQHYAVEGFELNSVDYLLKPIIFERFYQSVQKVFERNAFKTNSQETAISPNHLFIKQNNRLIRVNFDQILYIQAEKDFSSFYLEDKRILAGMHLKIFEATLPENLFIRVHRSYIINISKLTSIKGNIIEISHYEIPIGANYKEDLYSKLGI